MPTVKDIPHAGAQDSNNTAPDPGGIPTARANRLASGMPGQVTVGGRAFLVPQALEGDLGAFAEEAIKINARRRDRRLMELFKELRDYELAKQFYTESEAAERADFTAMLRNREMDDASYNFHRAAMSAEGAAFLLWVMARRAEPGLQLADVRALVTEDNATSVGIELLSGSGLAKADPNSAGGTGTP
jgi:hypothetical protein